MHEEIFRLPTCGWPEDPEEKWIGTWMEEMLNSGIDGILRAYQLRVAGLTMEQHQVCTTSPLGFSIFDPSTTLWMSSLDTEESALPFHSRMGPISDGGSYYRQLLYQFGET